MSRGSISFLDDDAFAQWADAFDQLARGGMNDVMIEEWEDATERGYVDSQSAVHVDTSFLKGSGSWDVFPTVNEIAGEVSYEATQAELEANQRRKDMAAKARAAAKGRKWEPKAGRQPPRNYGQYEHERGGEHAWLVNAMAANHGQFERALSRGYERTVLGRWS